MVLIGRLRKDADGVLRGAITLLQGAAEIEIVSQPREGGRGGLQYRVFSKGREIGFGAREADAAEDDIPLTLEGADDERSIKAVLRAAEGPGETGLFDLVIETF